MSKRKIQRIFTGEILEKPIRTYYRHLALKRGKLKATINSINTDNTSLNEINPIILLKQPGTKFINVFLRNF